MAEVRSNEIKLRSVSELLGTTFFIPSYQRGYRWDKQQVDDLLNDIYAFATKQRGSARGKEFYCLQPIVVRKFNKNDEEITKDMQSGLNNQEWYEVIDGQQRLTTIRILISYLVKDLYSGKTFSDRHRKEPFEILYETRQDSYSFLNDIDIGKSDGCIDFYFISMAYNAIQEWFNSFNKGDPQKAKERIRNTLINKFEEHEPDGTVQVIWYELNDKTNKPIDTFIRINMGKIPLTNAELIKALFLQKRKSEKNDEATELRKIEIANEWDKMEYALRNEDFWWFLNKKNNEIPARIEFLFNLIYELERQQDKKKADDWFGTDEHKIFRYFNSLFPDEITYEKIEDEWNKIKSYFYTFDEWFNKPVWYHYIGFLIYCGISVIDIYKIYKDKKKDEFTEELIKRIKEIFNKITCEKDNDNFYIPLSYDKNPKEIRQLLLLLNIEFIVQQYKKMMIYNNEEDVFIFKFPFKIFKKEDWDIEHIDSYTENPIKDKKTAIEWLNMAEEDLKDEISPELKNKIELFKNDKTDFNAFDSVKQEIIKIAEEEDNDEETKNSIGNLTLLDAGTNRGYGNSLFPTKRRKIIEKDMNGKFVPICTKNVFLKYFDEKVTSFPKWGTNDIKNYQNYIGRLLKVFLTFKGDTNE
jgi:uncharacterized protein with ParB-like and HNH nuclease domain